MSSTSEVSMTTSEKVITDKDEVEVILRSVEPATSSNRGHSAQNLERLIREHEFDPNFPLKALNRARELLEKPSTDPLNRVTDDDTSLASFLAFNDSPYAEVRAAVSTTDDPDTHVNTFRVWFLGTLIVVIGGGINEFFSTRLPSIWFRPFAAQLLCYPCGVAMARFLPTRRFRWRTWAFSFNPGPFTQKEHGLLTVMGNTGLYGVYVTTLIKVLKMDVFFNEHKLASSFSFQILLGLSTQLYGLGCAGITRHVLVNRPSMIWPSTLAQMAFNKALHDDDGGFHVRSWTISRRRFAVYCLAGMFVYFWLPNYLFQALTFFNWTTWISPQNVTLALVTGTLCGLGLNPWPTFDWNIISAYGDPIITPFFSMFNSFCGAALICVLIAPLMYWHNVFNTSYLPLNSAETFDRYGQSYNVSRVLQADFSVNINEYEAYSELYFSLGFILRIFSIMAATTAVVTHVLLYHMTELKTGLTSLFRRSSTVQSDEDVHNRLMRSYTEVPEWWYLIVLAFSIVCGICLCQLFSTGFPVWAFFFIIVLTFLLQLPVGIILAVTNNSIGLNMIMQLIAGYLLPGKAIANMIFKSYGLMGVTQSNAFTQDLKLGHYLKIAPRLTFCVQIYASVLCVFTGIAVNAWTMSNIPDLCHLDQKNHFICPGEHVFFSSAVLWGVIGPKRIFANGAVFHSFVWSFAIGAVLPVPIWLSARKFPKAGFRYWNVPLVLWGSSVLVFTNLSFVWPGFVVALFVNFFVKRRYETWWKKYAYVGTASFTAALTTAALVIFFAVQYKQRTLLWWGNTVPFAGVDGGNPTAPMCVLRPLVEGEAMP